MRPYQLRTPGTDDEWRRYHAIRREVLFEARGQFGVYDEHRPDEHLEGRHAMVLVLEGEVIGVIRIDIEPEISSARSGFSRIAIFRRVAIRADLQRHGHGRAMLDLAEWFARENGAKLIRSSVSVDAVGFYERCGFTREEPSEPTEHSVPMSKRCDSD